MPYWYLIEGEHLCQQYQYTNSIAEKIAHDILLMEGVQNAIVTRGLSFAFVI